MCEQCDYEGYIPEYVDGWYFASNPCQNCLERGYCPKCGAEYEQMQQEDGSCVIWMKHSKR